MPEIPTTALPEHTITLAVTGASGAIYATSMLRALERDERVRRVNLVVSENALRVLAEELKLGGRRDLLAKLLGTEARKTELLLDADVGSNIASGSYPATAMLVLPCSMGTLAAISHGLAASLIQRAADVMLKERRPLILCVRETPFNRIHLRNMLAAAEAGAVIFPAIPTLYNHPQTTTEMAENFVDRVLGHIGLTQPKAYVWQPD